MLAGAGIILGTAGGAFHYLSRDAQTSRDERCDLQGCDTEAIEYDDRYRTLNTVSNLSLILGGSLIVSGVTWWIIERVSTPRSVRRTVSLHRGTVQWAW